jgi:hypothetical protein
MAAVVIQWTESLTVLVHRRQPGLHLVLRALQILGHRRRRLVLYQLEVLVDHQLVVPAEIFLFL